MVDGGGVVMDFIPLEKKQAVSSGLHKVLSGGVCFLQGEGLKGKGKGK